MNHVHEECGHEPKYCAECQLVYCVKCGKEWKEPCQLAHYYHWSSPAQTSWVTQPYTIWTTPYYPTPTGSAGPDNIAIYQSHLGHD